MKTYSYNNASDTAEALIKRILQLLNEHKKKIFHIAFSGGSTPSLMFDLWSKKYKEVTPWDQIRIYWVDERCVPPEDSESNYGTMRRILLENVPIRSEYVFPINGENPPEEEAKNYSKQIEEQVPFYDNYPVFDLILLGAGEDGHTSSIFPGQEFLLTSTSSYVVSRNPNGQKRIAMTGLPLLHAKKIIFLITGKSKAKVVKDMIASEKAGPAAYIAHHAPDVTLYIDQSANV